MLTIFSNTAGKFVRQRLTLVFAGLLLSACQPSSENSSNLSFKPPERLLQTRAIDQNNLTPLVRLNDGTVITMRPAGNNTWQGTVNVEPNNSYYVAIEWIETLAEGDIVLAQWAQNVDVNDDGVEIVLSESSYDYSLDFDGDQITNLEERQNNTNPFINNNQVAAENASQQNDADTGTVDNNPPSQPVPQPAPQPSDTDNTNAEPSTPVMPDNSDTSSEENASSGEDTTPAEDASSEVEEEVDSSDVTNSVVDAGSDDTVVSEPSSGSDEPTSTDEDAEAETPPSTVNATVLIPRISSSEAPAIDGLGVVDLDSQDNLKGEWKNAVQFDNFGARLWIKNLMIDVKADGNDGAELRRWAAMHDGEYLYVLVLSDDVGARKSDSESIWQDDAVELFIDGNNSKLSSWGDADDYHMLIPLMKQDSKSSNNELNGRYTSGPGSDSLAIEFSTGPGKGPDGIRQYNWEQDVYEIAIPIDSAGITLGAEVGFEIQIDDDDDGDSRDSKWGWFHPSRTDNVDTDLTFQDPSIMGTVVLEE